MTLTDSLVIALALTIVYKIILEYESKNRNILTKYYDIKLNKYIAWCRIKVGNDWRYQRLFFPDAEPWKKLREGDFVNIE